MSSSSSHVAMSTVAGMVLGVCESSELHPERRCIHLSHSVGLFVLVCAYQFVPRKGKSRTTPTSSSVTSPSSNQPLLARIGTRCTTFFTSRIHKRSPPPTTPAGSDTDHPSHRPLRSFHLTSQRKREREATRQKFAQSLRLKIDIPTLDNPFSRPRTPTPGSSPAPRPPKSAYRRMRDSGDKEHLLSPSVPDSALLSPWSPSADGVPHTPPPKFKMFASPLPSPGTPPPLYPPPPAYVPGTPLRGALAPAPPPDDERLKKRFGLVDPFDDAAKAEEGQEDADTLMQEIHEIIQYTMGEEGRSRRESDNFVIGEHDEDETGSLSECSI